VERGYTEGRRKKRLYIILGWGAGGAALYKNWGIKREPKRLTVFLGGIGGETPRLYMGVLGK